MAKLNKFGIAFLICFFLVLLCSGQLIPFILLIIAYVLIFTIVKGTYKGAVSQYASASAGYGVNQRKPWVNRPGQKAKASKPIPKQLQQKLASRKN